MLSAIETALATTTQLLGKPHNILVMGRACFLRVPVSEANDLNYWLGMMLLEGRYLLLNIFQIATVEVNFALYA